MLTRTETLYELLRKDHERLTVACADLRAHVGDEDFAHRAAPLFALLRQHERAEDEILTRPLTLRVPDGALVEHLRHQQQELDRAIDELARARSREDRTRALDELTARLAAHVRFEHERVFPASAYLFSRKAQRRMADRYADERLAAP